MTDESALQRCDALASARGILLAGAIGAVVWACVILVWGFVS
jgi:hypothetical protein